MGRRPTATGVSPRAVITAASVLPGVPLPGWTSPVGSGPTRFLPPPVEDAEPPAPAPTPPPPSRPRPRHARIETALPGGGEAETDDGGLVQARVLIADRPVSPPPAAQPPAGRIPFPLPEPAAEPAPEPTAPTRGRAGHRAPAPTRAPGHGAGAMLVVAVLVIAVVGLAFVALVVPGLVDPAGHSSGTTPDTHPRAVALSAPPGYRAATGAAARAMVADARAQLGDLGVASVAAGAYAKAGGPIQVVAAGMPMRTGATGKQAYLGDWHRATRARSVSSVAGLPAEVVGTCGKVRAGGAGCAFAGDEVAGLLWLPDANPAAAARALPAVVRSVHVVSG